MKTSIGWHQYQCECECGCEQGYDYEFTICAECQDNTKHEVI